MNDSIKPRFVSPLHSFEIDQIISPIMKLKINIIIIQKIL